MGTHFSLPIIFILEVCTLLHLNNTISHMLKNFLAQNTFAKISTYSFWSICPFDEEMIVAMYSRLTFVQKISHLRVQQGKEQIFRQFEFYLYCWRKITEDARKVMKRSWAAYFGFCCALSLIVSMPTEHIPSMYWDCTRYERGNVFLFFWKCPDLTNAECGSDQQFTSTDSLDIYPMNAT